MGLTDEIPGKMMDTKPRLRNSPRFHPATGQSLCFYFFVVNSRM